MSVTEDNDEYNKNNDVNKRKTKSDDNDNNKEQQKQQVFSILPPSSNTDNVVRRKTTTSSDRSHESLEKDISNRLSGMSSSSRTESNKNDNQKDLQNSAHSNSMSKRRQKRNDARSNSRSPRGQQQQQQEQQRRPSSSTKKTSSTSQDERIEISSLLPPLIPPLEKSKGVSSWEDILGGSSRSRTTTNKKESEDSNNDDDDSNGNSNSNKGNREQQNQILPSIADLFPPDLSTSTNRGDTTSSKRKSINMDGVLPVGELFYRSSQSINEDDNSSYDNFDANSKRGDDEDLLFSAELTDQLSTPRNKLEVRRNKATRHEQQYDAKSISSTATSKPSKNRSKSSKRLVRRGIEMLVGGVPINADPPQRVIEISYNEEEGLDWSEVITTDTRDFGPMLYGPTVGKLSREEKGLFCEYFVNCTLKWNVCPTDLQKIVNNEMVDDKEQNPIDSSVNTIQNESIQNKSIQNESNDSASLDTQYEPDEEIADDSSQTLGRMKEDDSVSDTDSELNGELVFSLGVTKEELESSDSELDQLILESVLARGIVASTESTGCNVTFTKLQLSDLGDGTTRIYAEFTLSVDHPESMSFAEMRKKRQRISSSLAQAMDDGDMALAMASACKDEDRWPEDLRNRIMEEFLFDDDDGDESISNDKDDNAAAPEESTESFSELDSESSSENTSSVEYLSDGTKYEVQGFDTETLSTGNDDIFHGGGLDGVFWNYGADNILNAPYQGTLGLRLVDAVEERAKQRVPRLIAIGDVHGCVDELSSLLRECDYRPGDLVVFLGDLVSKGPDSVSVVQMAREIGAIGVRGNHDFEVIRWHQAIKSGVDPPVVRSEHYHIANGLTTADMKWLCSLPWYVSSPDLGALFVHAGFVSGIRLAKQNPRLMMNMRSILPDGTVTSKFFNNWPWARLWDGPQTVIFGHDADRGLQQYEHAIGLDTGCVYGGRLTACILPEKRLVSVKAKKAYFQYRRKHYD